MTSAGLIFRFVIQRASHAEVNIEGVSCGRFEKGLVVLVGIGSSAEETRELGPLKHQLRPLMEKAIDKLLALRIFEDEAQKMNLSVSDSKGGLYLISQFTLFADVKKGNRPSFTTAAKPYLAEPLFEELVYLTKLKAQSLGVSVYSGKFAADMKVSLVNDGPVTILFDANEETGISGL